MKRVLITGGGRGIGARIAEAMAGRGDAVSLCARTRGEIEATAARVRAQATATVLPFVCDVADAAAVDRMVAEALVGLGGIDVLVNNAAVPGPVAELEAADLDAWRRAIDVNLLGAVHCCRAVLPHMKRRGHGKIVNIAGGGVGWHGFDPLKTAYITSKFALYGLTESLAGEVAGDNIQVNAVSPGPTDTRLRDALLAAGDPRKAQAADLSPDACTRMVAFLGSDASGALTGKILSARWDDPERLAREIEALGRSSHATLRRIDGTTYVER